MEFDDRIIFTNYYGNSRHGDDIQFDLDSRSFTP